MARKLLINQIKAGMFVDCKIKTNFNTKENEFTVVIIMTKAGEIQILFPPSEIKVEEFNKRFEFGDLVEIDAIANVRDIQISIYKDELSVKILANYLEED